MLPPVIIIFNNYEDCIESRAQLLHSQEDEWLWGLFNMVFIFILDVKVTLRQDFMDVLRVGIRHGE